MVRQENSQVRGAGEHESTNDKIRVVRLLPVHGALPIDLYESITKLVDSQGRWKLNNPIVWTPELVRRLEASKDKITHVVDHWLDWIIGGFITKFTIDT